MLRIVKILLILAVAMWALLGVVENFGDWAGTKGAIAAATTMGTFDGGAESWKATGNPAVILAGALFIVSLKILAGVLCLSGAWRMWGARGGDKAAFAVAKVRALAGCGVAMFMLFAGWIVIAETWFEMWRSDVMREVALGSAFRYCGMIGVIALFVGMGED